MKLKEIRESNGITQTKLAADLNIPLMTYNNYENKKAEPNIKMLKKLANYFNVSLDYLCDRQYNNNIGYIPDNVKDTVKKLIQLQEIDLAKADAYITALLEK